MPYASNAALPKPVRDALPSHGQAIYRAAYNSAEKQHGGEDESRLARIAWGAVKQSYKQDAQGEWHAIEKVLKFDTERQYVFGWASVAITKDGHQVEDLQGDLIDPEDLENAAYEFARDYRSTGVMHQGEVVGQMIESFMVTPDKLEAMGLPPDSLPQGHWVGFHIPDAEIFGKIKDGTYSSFSIQGDAIREEV